MPTFNRGYCIQNAIASAMKQRFGDWELIIIDDGSTDNTERVVESFISNKIKYFKFPHTGLIPKIRNLGCQKARGELIVVQDSDDVSYPDRLERIWDFYQKNDFDVIYHDMYVRSFDPEHNAYLFELREAGEYDKNKLIERQYIPGQIAYKKSVWEKIPYNEEILMADDMMFLIELALNNCKFGYINRPLYEYNILEDSVNINAELDGRRLEDTKTMVKILKEKYGIEAIGELKQWEKQSGKVLKQQYVK